MRGEPAAAPALAGGIVCAIAWASAREPKRKKWRTFLVICAVPALAFGGWHQWELRRGYSIETVSFDNRGARLVGTLYLPDRIGKRPGAVWSMGPDR